MKDIFTEDAIKREKNDGNLIKMIVFIVLAVLFVFLNLFRIIVGVGYILGAVCAYLAFSCFTKQNVEYDFSMVNEQVEVAAIYNKQQRKKLLEFSLSDAKVVAPSDAPRLEGARTGGMKRKYFGSGYKDRTVYSIIGTFHGMPMEIQVEPTEKILHHIRQICRDVFYEE